MPRACPACGGPTSLLHAEAVDREGPAGPPTGAALERARAAGLVATYVACEAQGCGVVARDPMPSPEALAASYATYYTHAPLGWPRRVDKRVRAWLWARAQPLDGPVDARVWPASEKALRAPGVALDTSGVRPRARDASALDVGCGQGEGLVMLRGLGFAQVVGIESDPAARAAASGLGFDVRAGTAEALPVADASFDVVYLRHVLEHAVDPRAALAECARALRPGGVVSLVTPNPASRLHARLGARWRGLEAPRHLHLFPPAALARLVREAGLEVVQVGSSDRSAAWMEAVSSDPRRARPGEAETPLSRTLAPGTDERGEETFVLARRSPAAGAAAAS